MEQDTTVSVMHGFRKGEVQNTGERLSDARFSNLCGLAPPNSSRLKLAAATIGKGVGYEKLAQPTQ